VSLSARPRDRSYGYRLFGLDVVSDIRLDELGDAAAPSATPDVVIRHERIPPIDGEQVENFSVTPGGAGILNVVGAGRFLIEDGRRILVEPDPAGSERNVRLFLLGSAFGSILHQRGLLPLHANAIEIGGKAIAFLGHSGAGKSTMAAWFHDHGFNDLADDVCVVTQEGARPIAHPGIPRLRLWREALEASGRNVAEHELSFDDMDKYNVATRAREGAEPLPLGAVYLLERAEAGTAGTVITALSGMAAVDALVSNTYRGGYLTMMGGTARHLAACVALARAVPVFTVSRAWGLERLGAELQLIERHAREAIRDAAA